MIPMVSSEVHEDSFLQEVSIRRLKSISTHGFVSACIMIGHVATYAPLHSTGSALPCITTQFFESQNL